MKKIAVLSRQEEELTACLSGVQGYAIQYSESPEILPDTACVLISQESAGASLREKAQHFRWVVPSEMESVELSSSTLQTKKQ